MRPIHGPLHHHRPAKRRRFLTLHSCQVDLSTGDVSEGRGRLTTRELTLLTFLVERPGQDVSREMLLTEAFGYARVASSRAVDKAMSSLRAKVEASASKPEHLITVVGTGYRFVAPHSMTPDLPHPASEANGEARLGAVRPRGRLEPTSKRRGRTCRPRPRRWTP